MAATSNAAQAAPATVGSRRSFSSPQDVSSSDKMIMRKGQSISQPSSPPPDSHANRVQNPHLNPGASHVPPNYGTPVFSFAVPPALPTPNQSVAKAVRPGAEPPPVVPVVYSTNTEMASRPTHQVVNFDVPNYDNLGSTGYVVQGPAIEDGVNGEHSLSLDFDSVRDADEASYVEPISAIEMAANAFAGLTLSQITVDKVGRAIQMLNLSEFCATFRRELVRDDKCWFGVSWQSHT